MEKQMDFHEEIDSEEETNWNEETNTKEETDVKEKTNRNEKTNTEEETDLTDETNRNEETNTQEEIDLEEQTDRNEDTDSEEEIDSNEETGVSEESDTEEEIDTKEEIYQEICQIKQSKEKLTYETYCSMSFGLMIAGALVNNDVENDLESESTCARCLKIVKDLKNIEKACSFSLRECVSSLNKCVILLFKWLTALMLPDMYGLDQRQHIHSLMEESFKSTSWKTEACYLQVWKSPSTVDKILVSKIRIIYEVLSFLKPESAVKRDAKVKREAPVLGCLQHLQKLHDVPEIREMFRGVIKGPISEFPKEDLENVITIHKMNQILFQFVKTFFKTRPTVEQWPATIHVLSGSVYNLLIEETLSQRLIDVGIELSNITHIFQSAILPHKSQGKSEEEVYNKIQMAREVENGFSATIRYSSITVDEKGGCFCIPVASAFLIFPPDAVLHKVSLTCGKVLREQVELRKEEEPLSRILKIEPEGLVFREPVTVLLTHFAHMDQDFLDFYELIVENINTTEGQELKTEIVNSIEDVLIQTTDKMILNDYLPFAKASINETCTLVATAHIKSNHILIPTNGGYVFSEKYGENKELKITFPAGVTEEIRCLKVQLFPAVDIFNESVYLDDDLFCAPVIKVSGKTSPFLKPVDVELTYSYHDVAKIKEEFLPVGKKIRFTTEYGLLLQCDRETESISECLLNETETNEVYVERPMKDQLKFSFSVEHLSNFYTVVNKDISEQFPTHDVANTNVSHRLHDVVVLGTDETDGDLADSGVVKTFMRQRCNPGIKSKLSKNLRKAADLIGKSIHFLLKKCQNGRSHRKTAEGDCRPKASIVEVKNEIFDEPSRIINPQQYKVQNVPPPEDTAGNDLTTSPNKRFEKFVEMIENEFFKKWTISESAAKKPVHGKFIKRLKLAGALFEISLGVGMGVSIALGVSTFGIGAFVPAAFAGGTLFVSKVYERKKKSCAKKNIAEIKRFLDVGSLGLIKDVGKELCRIFEYQLLRLEDDDDVEKLAKCAVSLMFDLKNEDKINRNTLIRKVLQDGKLKKAGKKQKLRTGTGVRWNPLHVFRKPGLQRTVLDADGVKIEYYVKKNDDCDPLTYGYRGEFLELINGGCEEIGNATNEANGCEKMCKEFSKQYEDCGSGTHFHESDIDRAYDTSSEALELYYPVHVLLRCPNVLDSFIRNSQKEPSLANFLKTRSRPREDRRVLCPVYRQRTSGRIPSMTKVDLRGSDFSHADFTDSHLEGCNLTNCVMLFAVLERAKISGSTFNSTLISHSNLVQAEFINRCPFLNTRIHHSRVNDAVIHGIVNYGDVTWTGTNVDDVCLPRTNNSETNHPMNTPSDPRQMKRPRTTNHSTNTQGDQPPMKRQKTTSYFIAPLFGLLPLQEI